MANNVQGNSCGFKEVTVDAEESGTIQSCGYTDITVGNNYLNHIFQHLNVHKLLFMFVED